MMNAKDAFKTINRSLPSFTCDDSGSMHFCLQSFHQSWSHCGEGLSLERMFTVNQLLTVKTTMLPEL